LKGERTPEGFYRLHSGIETAIARGLAYAPHADLVWCETSTPNLAQAKQFAEAIRRQHPGKLLAYNCSPSFNWKHHLDDDTSASSHRAPGQSRHKFQFAPLAGFHAPNFGMFDLPRK